MLAVLDYYKRNSFLVVPLPTVLEPNTVRGINSLLRPSVLHGTHMTHMKMADVKEESAETEASIIRCMLLLLTTHFTKVRKEAQRTRLMRMMLQGWSDLKWSPLQLEQELLRPDILEHVGPVLPDTLFGDSSAEASQEEQSGARGVPVFSSKLYLIAIQSRYGAIMQ